MSDRYRYRAATPNGQILEGILEASSRKTALDELRSRQLYPMTLEAAPARKRKSRSFLGRRAAVTVWARDVATLLDAGLPLDRVLAVTADHATHEGLSEAVAQVRRSVQGGSSLAEALGQHPRYFPPLVPAMVEAGEASGALETVFEQIAAHLEETAELRSQIQSALIYPALMAVVASIGVTVLLLFVVPRFSGMLEEVGGSLPMTTRLLVSGSELLTGWWWLWVILIVLGVLGVRRAMQDPQTKRRWHSARLEWPWLGDLETKYTTARFARTLGILLKSGVAIVPSLKIARGAIGNLALAERIERAAAGVAEGSALAPTLSGTLPPLALQMIAVGEESGRLEDLCLRVANTYDGEVRRALRTLVSLIEPAMILFFGALVGFVALSMLQAIYSINTSAF
ncbi:MAG: type II secretion system F family protein [Gemmatimonadales bacterium]|jgi:type II secretory pathway component PulF